MIKILEFQVQHQSFQWTFRVDFPWGWLVWSPCCARGFQELSLAPPFEGINSLAFCLLYSPVLTTIHDRREDHSLVYTDLCQQSNISALQHTVSVYYHFPAKKQLSSDFTAAVTVCSDFGAQEEAICHCFRLFSSCSPYLDSRQTALLCSFPNLEPISCSIQGSKCCLPYYWGHA